MKANIKHCVLQFTTQSETKKNFSKYTWDTEPNYLTQKNPVAVDSKELLVCITRIPPGGITDHLNNSKYRRGMRFTQKKKPINTVSTKKLKLPICILRKSKKSSLGSRFDNKSQIAIAGTKHSVTTDENKVLHRKLLSNPMPSQNAATLTKRINTRTVAITDRPSIRKLLKRPKLASIKRKNFRFWKILKKAQTYRGEKNNFEKRKSSYKPRHIDRQTHRSRLQFGVRGRRLSRLEHYRKKAGPRQYRWRTTTTAKRNDTYPGDR